MNNQKRVFVTVCMLAFSMAAGAQEIYQRRNADGVLEFSDRPFASGGTQVEVRPNVVVTNPVSRPKRAPAAAADSEDVTPAASPPRQLSGDDGTNYVRGRRTRAAREARENRRESRKYRNEEPGTNPNPGQATRNAARAIANRPGAR